MQESRETEQNSDALYMSELEKGRNSIASLRSIQNELQKREDGDFETQPDIKEDEEREEEKPPIEYPVQIPFSLKEPDRKNPKTLKVQPPKKSPKATSIKAPKPPKPEPKT